MSRPLSTISLELLRHIQKNSGIRFHEIEPDHVYAKTKKQVYDTIYRLQQQELISAGTGLKITKEGIRLIHSKNPARDGIWKIIIFDIPESQRPVRNFLRQRLTSLGFKKWQNSIWVSPFTLEPELEQELKHLAGKYFVRLIKTTDINHVNDLERLFPTQ